MNVHSWVKYELKATGMSVVEFFEKCHKEQYGTCSNVRQRHDILMDASYFDRTGLVISTAKYVWSEYDKMKAAIRVLPARAVP